MTEWEVLAVAFWLPDVNRAAQKIRHSRGYCRLPIADCRLPIADCRLPIADCRLPIADCRLPIADCRLPIADCRLPIADCRLPIADCRLPILRQRCLRSSWFGWFVSCLFLLYYANGFCHRQMPLYPKKTRISSFFVIFLFRHSRPCNAGAGMTAQGFAIFGDKSPFALSRK